MSRHEADELEGEYVGVGEAHELVPVPGHHLGDVESHQEGYGNQMPESKKTFLTLIVFDRPCTFFAYLLQ